MARTKGSVLSSNTIVLRNLFSFCARSACLWERQRVCVVCTWGIMLVVCVCVCVEVETTHHVHITILEMVLCLSHTTESPLFFDSLHFNCFLTIPKHCYSFSYTYFSSCQLNFHLLPFNLSNHVPPTPLVNNTRITYPFAIKVGWCFDFSFSVSCLSWLTKLTSQFNVMCKTKL